MSHAKLDFSLYDSKSSETSIYSSLKPWHIDVDKIMLKHIKPTNNMIILDAMANVGFDTLNFATIYPDSTIYSVEINDSEYKILQKNIDIFIVQSNKSVIRFTTINDDILSCLTKFKSDNTKFDFIYFDPPWTINSKINYKNQGKKFMLQVKNTIGTLIPIYDVISDCLLSGLTSKIILKSPVEDFFDLKLFKSELGKNLADTSKKSSISIAIEEISSEHPRCIKELTNISISSINPCKHVVYCLIFINL